jgi:hypothetical protein
MESVKIFECGCCGCYHPNSPHLSKARLADLFDLDCRNDELRYGSPEDAQERNNGAPIIMIELDEEGEYNGEWLILHEKQTQH